MGYYMMLYFYMVFGKPCFFSAYDCLNRIYLLSNGLNDRAADFLQKIGYKLDFRMFKNKQWVHLQNNGTRAPSRLLSL